MACIYYYKGYKFESEIDLDNFLLTKEKYYEKFGDIVFNSEIKLKHLREREKLYDLRKKNRQLWDDYIRLKDSGTIEVDEDGDFYVQASSQFRYTGVNFFLSLQRKHIDDKTRLFPEFIVKNYFENHRHTDWSNGVFTDEEVDMIFDGDRSKTKPLSKSEFKNLEDLIINKWKLQAKAGDSIHEIFLIFFSKQNYNLSDDEIFNIVKERMSKGKNLPYLLSNGEVDANIKIGIQVARNIYNNIVENCGEDCVFYPEYVISGTATNNNNKDYNIFGKIDLLVLDKNGKLHLYDYKTSVKSFDLFDVTKKEAYSYLLVTYAQMLENAGIDISLIELGIIPVQIQNFKKVQDRYEFDNLEYIKILNITNERMTDIAQEEIEYYMPSKYQTLINCDDVYKNVTESMALVFPDNAINKEITEKSIENYLNTRKIFDKKNENDEYEVIIKTHTGQNKIIKSKDKAEIVKLVFEERKKLLPTRTKLMNRFIDSMTKAIEAEDPNVAEFIQSFINRTGASSFLKDTILSYCNKEWEIKRIPLLEALEIVTLYNKRTGLVDFIGISTNLLHDLLKLPKGKKLVGLFETDAQAEQKFKRLTLDGVVGNAELMQIMFAINSINLGKNYKVGNISVINPYDALLVNASNEALLMNFNTLCKHAGITNNKFDSGEIELCDYWSLLENKLNEIWALGDSCDWKDSELIKYKTSLSTAKSMIDLARQGDLKVKIEAVLKLLVDMLRNLSVGNELRLDYTELAKLESRKIKLYNLTLFTLAELKGIHFRQLLSDHAKWFSSLHKTLTEGQAANYQDNPGNLESETLNLITMLVKEANLNIRDDVVRERNEFVKIINKLKKDIGFTYLKENIGFNQADIYKEIYREQDGDLFFKKVEEVRSEYKPLLSYMLENINKRRLANSSPSELLQMIDNYDPRYYQVPVTKGGLDSEASAKGLFKALVSKLKFLNPMNWPKLYDELMTKLNGVEANAQAKLDLNLIYSLENYFDKGETNRELTIRAIGGVSLMERNAETLMLKYIFAYSLKEHINNVFPMMQAAAAHLSIQGANAGITFESDKLYLEEYIRSKIKKESIVTPLFQGVHKYLSILKQAASKMTLAFTPVQMLYLPLQGLWVDISLIIRKPDGTQAFTFLNFKNSLKLVYGDLFNFSGKPTLCSLLNEYYALNDMDINKYIDNITHNKKGLIYNFDGMAFKFASRPDFYNRLAIFLSQMQGDGCLEAHSVVDGKLKYDWTKDKRFAKFAADPKNKNNKDPEYIKQRALYYAVANLLVAEGAKNEDGSLFELDMNDPKPLPKAYTVKQAESHKSLADDIYGYYSEENKSLIQSTALGSMWLLFKTFWSGKKNQYLQSGGVRMRGTWEHYTETLKDEEGNPILDENGLPKIVEYYYDINEDGSVNYNKIVKKDELPPNKLLAPVIYWKGQWLEGIALTMTKLCQKGLIIANYHKLMQEDPDMARCYKSNINLLWYDMLLFLIGGGLIGGLLADWLKELLKDNKDNTDFLVGCGLAAANVAVWTVRNSFLDFNFFDSIGSPITEWTPFALSFLSNNIKNLGSFAVGDLDLFDTMVRTNGWSKQVKPIFDSIKPEMFRTKQEGGTWTSGWGGGSTAGGGASGNY